VFPENGYGYSEETKAMLNTSHGWVPWDDQHHISLSLTNGEQDGRWMFANANNTPRVARVDLKNRSGPWKSGNPERCGNHSSPFITENSEYIVAGTRFSVPMDDQPDVSIQTYKDNFRGTASFISINPEGRTYEPGLPGAAARVSTSTSAAPAKARATTGSSSPATTPNAPTRCSK
jgi:nitrous-oxide reductase